MEFSFDRSKTSSTQQAQNQANQANEEIDTSKIANERLRKAIERNRARQKERESSQPQAQSTNSTHSSAWAQHQAHTSSREEMVREPVRESTQANLFDKPSESKVENRTEPKTELKDEPRAHVRTHLRREMPKDQAPMATRKSVARPDEAEFAPVKRTTKRAASQISYTTGSRSKGKDFDPKLINYLVKGSWIFCGFLILRLIYANGGVVDFFSQKKILNERFSELSRIKKENMSLVHEIERMQYDVAFQKRLVRDNLGFIAQDEFLILFPKE